MKRYIKSFTTDQLKQQLGDNYPEGGYLYIFKHGIGPGTIPRDVEIVRTKDLPNYYTAVWLDRFLTTPELKQYDIPDETRINELLGRIGYCQKNGDVVPCDEVEASTKITADAEYGKTPTISDDRFEFIVYDTYMYDDIMGAIDNVCESTTGTLYSENFHIEGPYSERFDVVDILKDFGVDWEEI